MSSFLSPDQVEAYLKPMTPDQVASITNMRGLIMVHAPYLVEEIDQGKWFGGLLTYSTTDGTFMFALGPRSNGATTFHMMPFYGSKSLQERHGTALKKFLSGKSCIRFVHAADLPQAALIDIIKNGAKMIFAFGKK